MRNQHLVLFVFMLTLALAAFAGAQESPEPQSHEAPAEETSGELILSDPDSPETHVVTGKAVNASPDEIIVETDDGRRVFVVDTESLYPEPIAEGQTVTVWFVERADQLFATALEVGDHLDPKSLPQTASYQPLYALAALLAFAGAWSLSRMRRSVSH